MASDEFEAALAREFNRFRGRLAGFIEACGLPERTERSIVSEMKNLSYDAQKAIKELDGQ